MSKPPYKRKKTTSASSSDDTSPDNQDLDENAATATITLTAVEIPELTEQEQSDRGSILQRFYAWSDKVVCPSIPSTPSLPQKMLFPPSALSEGDRAVLPLSTLELQQQ